MAQRPNARRVLVVGGASGPVLEQILLYPVDQLDCIQLDPMGTELSRQYLRGPDDRRIRHLAGDPRVFVRETRARYDVIITNLFDPTTLQLNRFYTAEYFAAVSGALAEGGVFSLAIGEYNDSLTEELSMILASTHHTLQSVFARVLVFPTERVTLLASNSELTRDIADSLECHGIRLRSLNRSWFEATLSADRFAELERATRALAPVNRDAWPVLTRHVVHGWLQRFDAGIVPWFALVVGLVAAASMLRGRVPFLIASLGFAASGLEVLLLIGLQMLAGAVYGALCAVVSAYLFGSTAGALITRHCPTQRARQWLVSMAIGSAGIAFATYLFIRTASTAAIPTSVCVLVVVTLAALSGCVTGATIPLGIKARQTDTPKGFARIFSADLAGAAIGASAVGVVLIPRLGVTGTVGVLCGICLLGAVGPALTVRSAT
jgi:spermidine synthase